MKKKLRYLLVTLALAIASHSASAAMAVTGQVYMASDPGSWVGGGLGAPTVLWTHGIDGIFQTSAGYNNAIDVSFNNGQYWNFDFASPVYNPVTNALDGPKLTVGLYDNATRYPFNSPTRPGMDISGNGRGDNQLFGWFDILEIGFTPTGDITKLAVDWRQYDEATSATGPSLFGSLRINSDIAINTTGVPVAAVPLPAAWIGFVSGLAVLVRRRRAKA